MNIVIQKDKFIWIDIINFRPEIEIRGKKEKKTLLIVTRG